MALTELQKKFVTAFVENGGNGAHAVVEAGYSEVGAKQEAWRLLRDPKIVKAIEEATLANRAKYGPGVIQTLEGLMTNSQSERTRLEAAKTLAKVIGLETSKAEITFRSDESPEEIRGRIEATCRELGIENPLKLVK